jgi:hypothetical protein
VSGKNSSKEKTFFPFFWQILFGYCQHSFNFICKKSLGSLLKRSLEIDPSKSCAMPGFLCVFLQEPALASKMNCEEGTSFCIFIFIFIALFRMAYNPISISAGVVYWLYLFPPHECQCF